MKKEVTYMSRSVNNSTGEVELAPITKTITLKELSQTDKSQGRLFFMLRPLYKSVKMVGEIDSNIVADPSILYDITNHAIDVLIEIDANFTESDKKEFLQDNYAVMEFGEWFLETATPFFLTYLTNYRKA